MNRRRFVSGVAALMGMGAVGVAAVPASRPERFTYRGWAMRWSGWLKPVNQVVELGYWSAHKGERIVVAATTGTVSELRTTAACFSTCRESGWPWIDATSTDGERAEVQRRALDELMRHIGRA